jgi:hypothetical protein
VHKIIARIKGGLGNQLFCYAAARRLALVNNAELVIDDVTGFARDLRYRRQYMLDHFHLSARRATPDERLEPFERYRRGIQKWFSRNKPFAERRYLEQENIDFDARLMDFKIDGTVYLDGYWQSEGYFIDVEAILRDDLRFIAPTDHLNLAISDQIRENEAVAVHVRWFDSPDSERMNNVATEYYRRAVALINDKFPHAHFFLFSDDPLMAQARIPLPATHRVTCISHNHGETNAYADLWLMSQCQHFITANSTFSWWGAWLGEKSNSLVITPDPNSIERNNGWGAIGLIPLRWSKL